MKYEYTNLGAGERQYDDVDLKHDKIVNAKYVDTIVYRGNPYIEALPFAKSDDEIIATFNVLPSLPSLDEFRSYPVQIQDMILSKIKDYRIALPFHCNLEFEFSRALIESYAMREEKPANSEIFVKGIPYKVNTLLKAFHEGESICGFSLLGVAGCGKSTAMNMIFDHYPQVIIHNDLDSIERKVQIVYLFVTCEGNSNFNALYQAIGRAIDNALGNGNNMYETVIKNTSGGLGGKSLKVRELIEKFAIGVIVFDEIQNIDLSSTRENSIEGLLTMNNNTHVGIGVLGTEEAFKALFSKARTTRRFAYISAGRYCNDINTFSNIVRGLFISNLFEREVIPDKDIITAFWEESDGVISYVVNLYYYLMKDYVTKRRKPEITAAYIKSISKRKRKMIHDMINAHHKSTKMSEVTRRKLIAEMNEFEYDDEVRERDKQFNDAEKQGGIMFVKGDAIESIKNNYPDYNRGRIENAVNVAISKGANSEAEIVAQAVAYLKKHKTDKRRKGPKLISISTEEMLTEIIDADNTKDN